jgi:methyl-accepting chemotaxis protein
MILRKLKIGSRLAIGFGAVMLLLVGAAIGAVVLDKLNRDRLTATLAGASAKEQLAVEMKLLALEQSSALRNLVLITDLTAMAAENDRIKSLATSLDATRERLGKLELASNEREVLANLARIDAEFDQPVKTAFEYASIFRTEDTGNLMLNTIDPLVQRQLADLDTLVQQQRGAYLEALADSATTSERLMWITLGLVAGALVLALGFAWVLMRSITAPLAESVAVARRVASGDLTSRVTVEGRDEAAELLGALRDMNSRLGDMVTRIRSGAESIAVGASQVASGNQQLSSRTEEHASSLEETASTLEEFTTTVRQNAEHATQASALAGEASNTAERGGAVVAKVVETMREVTDSSKRIADIIGVIDGISFQTNILALNAAVEAARAGEQGRGFAVVASEVRSLAQRSASSAKEIRTLIEDSVGRVEAGARLVQQAGQTMDELVVSVRKVAAIMTEIASASHEQSSGIDQINKAITQMDHVVQMNASLVEEATAAATSMAEQATGLAHVVSQFRVEEGAPVQVPQPATPVLAGDPVPAPAATRAVAPPARREPALSDAGDDWKEF